MSRLRVLYILGSLAANDLGEELAGLIGHLPRDDFDPEVVNLGGREDLRDRLHSMGVRTHALGLVGPLGALRAPGRTRALLRRLEADVVHGYGSWGGAVAQLAAPESAAVVRSVTRPPSYERDLRGHAFRFLERRARPRVHTRFVVPNHGSVGLALRAYGAVEGHVTVLPTSVDVAAIRDRVGRAPRPEVRDALGLEPAHRACVLLTGFASGATMDHVLAGFSRAVRELPDLRLLVVGSGRYEGATRWKARELDLESTVLFLGRDDDEGSVWAAADVAIDATPMSSWSRPALAAIAAGVPTVKLQDGADGWSEDPRERLPMVSGEPERFANELVRLAADDDLLARIREEGADTAARVDVATVAARMGELYRSLVS